MPTVIRCPECDTSLRLANAPAAGQKVKCPKCGGTFVPEAGSKAEPTVAVPTRRPRQDDDEDAPPARRAPKPAMSLSDDEDDDDEAPRRRRTPAKARRDDDDEDDRPRPASRRRRRDEDDEDEDDRPRPLRKKGKRPAESGGGGLLIGLIAGVGVLGLLAVGGLVWFFVGKKGADKGDDLVVAPPADPAFAAPANPANPAVNGGGGGAAAAVPTQLSKDLMEKTRRATALIRVEAGNQSGSGSGFLVRANADAAYVITNFHVVHVSDDEPQGGAAPPQRPGMPGRPPGFPGRPPGFGPPAFGPFGPKQPAQKQKPKAKVSVVLNSGTPAEQSHPAEVVAIDPEADLATLRVTGVRNLPEVLDVTQDVPVSETMPVYIFGFPGGVKEITIGEGKVSQLRRDENNVLNDVQINGKIEPGNSGGPVVDAQGRLIGIAVATVRGKNIGFAVPAAQLDHMLKGSVLGALVFQPRQQGTRIDGTGELWFLDRKNRVLGRNTFQGTIGESTTQLKIASNEFMVLASLNDPMRKINAVNLHYARSTGSAAKPEAGGWAPIANPTTLALTLRDDEAVGTLRLPAGAIADDTYDFQFSYVNAAGQKVFTQPHAVRLTFPKNVKSVTLRVTTPADEPTRRYIDDTIMKTFTGMNVRVSRVGQVATVEIEPVDDPKTVIDKITFGEVVNVAGRTITVKVGAVELPVPTEQELTLALNDLKSTEWARRNAGADRLAKVYVVVPDRRAEIAGALHAAALDKDIFLRLSALRALNLWSGPESVAALLPGLDIQEGQTRVGICNILAKYKDATAAPALAKVLPGQFERGAASVALKAIGPAAEKSVIPLLSNKDSWTAREACLILKEIGTEASIPALQEVLKGKPDFMVGPAANDALKSIQDRKKNGK